MSGGGVSEVVKHLRLRSAPHTMKLSPQFWLINGFSESRSQILVKRKALRAPNPFPESPVYPVFENE